MGGVGLPALPWVWSLPVEVKRLYLCWRSASWWLWKVNMSIGDSNNGFLIGTRVGVNKTLIETLTTTNVLWRLKLKKYFKKEIRTFKAFLPMYQTNIIINRNDQNANYPNWSKIPNDYLNEKLQFVLSTHCFKA